MSKGSEETKVKGAGTVSFRYYDVLSNYPQIKTFQD